MRMLRILDLEGTSGLKDRDLSQIGNFLHLRYLSLRGCADIYHLPNSLGNLWDIQVLDVSGTSIIKLPKTITKLKKLHYLRAGNIPKDDDTSSIELKESCDLSKMEHEPIDDLEIPDVEAKSTLVLDVSGTSIIKLPKIITKLKKLHYLRAGNIPKDDATSSIELKESSDLSKMEHEPIDDLEIPDVEAKSVQFGMEQGTFLSLVVMELKDQGGLKSLTFMQGAMPRLELLQIDNCIHIDENGLSGVSSLPSLREVMLKGDHNEELMKNLCDQITLNQNQPVLKGA
ncbi:disease resistance protein PIK5-NP-like [Oryza sativa Japonica Group]|uniref:disease resistance protein PIK5-NP-like n=1 Tax=Oryza sativa subsp. japonica TaxID=39947 RepID=UPI00339B9EFC